MSKKNKEIINKEVSRLFNISDKSRYSDALNELRRKYKDEDLVNEIQQIFISVDESYHSTKKALDHITEANKLQRDGQCVLF